jgi:hypothetical protein
MRQQSDKDWKSCALVAGVPLFPAKLLLVDVSVGHSINSIRSETNPCIAAVLRMFAQRYLALQFIHVMTHHDCVLREPGQLIIFDFQLLLQQLQLLLQHWNSEQGCG